MIEDFKAIQNNDEFWNVLRQWWEGLEMDRGARAELRRAKSPAEIYVSRAFHRGLVAQLRHKGFEFSERLLERLALPAGALAHARKLSAETSFPRQLAAIPKASEEVRDTRFRKLLSVADSDRDELYRMILRLIRMLEGTVDLKSLTTGAVWWNDSTRRYWAEQYYTYYAKEKE